MNNVVCIELPGQYGTLHGVLDHLITQGIEVKAVLGVRCDPNASACYLVVSQEAKTAVRLLQEEFSSYPTTSFNMIVRLDIIFSPSSILMLIENLEQKNKSSQHWAAYPSL